MQRHILFDLDGTLIDSAPSILVSMEAAFLATSICPVRSLSRDLIGPPLQETMARLAGSDDPATLAALVTAFKLDYDSQGYRKSEVFVGVDAMLRSLISRGMLPYVATNKRIAPTRMIIEHLGWTGLFTDVAALDRYDPRHPDKAGMLGALLRAHGIDPADAVYIGDRDEDGVAAGRNGMRFIQVAWGYGDAGAAVRWERSASVEELLDAIVA